MPIGVCADAVIRDSIPICVLYLNEHSVIAFTNLS